MRFSCFDKSERLPWKCFICSQKNVEKISIRERLRYFKHDVFLNLTQVDNKEQLSSYLP